MSEDFDKIGKRRVIEGVLIVHEYWLAHAYCYSWEQLQVTKLSGELNSGEVEGLNDRDTELSTSLLIALVTGRDQILNLVNIHAFLHMLHNLRNISCFWFNFKKKPCLQTLKTISW